MLKETVPEGRNATSPQIHLWEMENTKTNPVPKGQNELKRMKNDKCPQDASHEINPLANFAIPWRSLRFQKNNRKARKDGGEGAAQCYPNKKLQILCDPCEFLASIAV